jgi:diguanylate cyclase (GGDEF)-like protein/PAS domain S-box-containing protein
MVSEMSEGKSVEHHRATGVHQAEPSARHSVSTERLRAAFEGMAVGMILKGPEGETLESNPALRRMLGYSEKELRGMVRSDYTHPEDAGRDAELYRQLLAGKRDSFRMEKRYVRKDGSIMWGRLSVSRIEGTEYESAFAVGVVEDITEQREAAQQIERLNRHNQLILDSAGEGIYGLDTEGKTTFVNPAATAMTGFDREDLIGKSQHEFVHHSYPDGSSYPREDCPIYAALTDGEIRHVDDEVFWRKDGTSFPVEYTSTPIRENSEVTGAVVTFTDITERKALEKRLQYQAFHDPLTGLPNRQLFVNRLEHALRRTGRQPNQVAVLFMDLDGFKVVNDSLGHEEGDKLLVAVAERLQGCLRSEDTLARFGGDEFIMLLEEIESPDDALRVTQRIIEEFRGSFVLEGKELFVRLSLGLALGDVHTKSSEELLRAADMAMYRAKEDAADYRVFDPKMYEQALRRMDLEHNLWSALKKDELRLYYQPKFSLGQTDKIEGIEALLRWEQSQRGLMLPEEFIPIAEETGLIISIGGWVMEEACRQARKWQERYPSALPLSVCVNLSAAQVRHPGLLKDVKSALRESSLEAGSLVLEITEGTLLKDTKVIETIFGDLKALGVRLIIDDFGKEYSSLSYLNRLPVDGLKIDGSFVESLGKDPSFTTIVEAVIKLAHSLGLEVTGEGVESAKQLENLRSMGCDFAQGYHLARPVPSEELDRLLADQLNS